MNDPTSVAQGALDYAVESAAASLERAHELMHEDMAVIPERAALVAIADQLALANTISLLSYAKESGELP